VKLIATAQDCTTADDWEKTWIEVGFINVPPNLILALWGFGTEFTNVHGRCRTGNTQPGAENLFTDFPAPQPPGVNCPETL